MFWYISYGKEAHMAKDPKQGVNSTEDVPAQEPQTPAQPNQEPSNQ